MASGQIKAAAFVPRDEEADREAQKQLQIAHNALRLANIAAVHAGWGSQIRDDMQGAEALVSHVRRAFQ